MYRAAVKRLLQSPAVCLNARSQFSRITPSINPTLAIFKTSPNFSTTATTDSLPNQSPNNPFAVSASSTTSSGTTEEEKARGFDGQSSRGTKPRTHYEDEQARVLNASLRHVMRLGWTEAAMIAGAREVGVSPSIVGSFPRKEAALVEESHKGRLETSGKMPARNAADKVHYIVHFRDYRFTHAVTLALDVPKMGTVGLGEFNNRRLLAFQPSFALRAYPKSKNLSDLVPSERIVKLVRILLELQAPYISKWPRALSIQAQPANVPNSFKQRAMLVDEIWHAVGDEASDVDWYVKRTVLAGIYSTTEIYMLTDASPDFRDTWAFLNGRVRDAFDLKKSIQQATYLAESIGAGMGSKDS